MAIKSSEFRVPSSKFRVKAKPKLGTWNSELGTRNSELAAAFCTNKRISLIIMLLQHFIISRH